MPITVRPMKQAGTLKAGRVRVGCHSWICREWRGTVYRVGASEGDWLREYAGAFDAVEANSPFYALPRPPVIERWAASVPPGFHFVPKFPRIVTHGARLAGAGAERPTAEFLERMSLLEGRLGPLCVQLPPDFGPGEIAALAAFLSALPDRFAYAVEVRHPGFFDEGPNERELHVVLQDHGADRAVFDTTALLAVRRPDAVTAHAQARKPRVPRRAVAVGRRPVVRWVGVTDVGSNRPALASWAATVATWAREGREVEVLVHHPAETGAAACARVFAEELHRVAPDVAGPPRAWAGEAAVVQQDLQGWGA